MDEKFWGKSAIINLHGCNSNIKNPEKIREFINSLIKEIDMKRYGPLFLDRFGEGNMEGYSCMQFIETSSIVAHFDEKKGFDENGNPTNRAFIDIFSCKEFDEKKAFEFCKEFFSANHGTVELIIRN